MLVMLSSEQWATSPGLFSNPPNVYFGCRWCQAPVRYAGLLTREGYAVQPATCEACGRSFELLLHGWEKRFGIVPVPQGLESPFAGSTGSPFGAFRASGPFEDYTSGGCITSPQPTAQADGDAD